MNTSLKSKKYIFDIDGTICCESPTFEKCLASPIPKMINIINTLYDQGNQITLYTARGWAEYKMTEKWLKDNNVKYHMLMCGKVLYDVWVDDRAANAEDFINNWKGE